MAQLADLVQKLQFKAQIVTGSQDAGKIGTVQLQQVILQAVTEHNPTLTLATMTQAEEQPVLILALIELCYIRAAEHGNDDPPKAGAGVPIAVGAQNTPFKNWMQLAADQTKRYAIVCARLGISGGAQNVVVVSTAYKQSERFGALFDQVQLPGAPPAQLSIEPGDDGAGSVNVLWQTTPSDSFVKYWLFSSLTPNLYRPQNPSGVMRIPNISPSCSLVHTSIKQDEQGCIVPNLTSGLTIYFLLVTQAGGRKFSYSNEVSIVVP